jgi:hypothetical protein
MGMRRYLLVALWPAGMTAIAAAVAVAARRAPVTPLQPAHGDPGDQDVAEPEEYEEYEDAFGDHDPQLPGWRQGLIQLAAISIAGGVLSYRVMELIGRPVLKYGPRIDEPVERWTSSHQVPAWAEVMRRLNNVGSSWTTWAAAGASGACLAMSWQRQKWLPPSLLASVIVVDKCTTSALRNRFGRLGPPGSPYGTYPAGGPGRVVLFTGLIANMLWREFSGTERGRVLAMGAIGVFAFNMAYCREYLSKHWLTDIVSGLVYGSVMYAPFAVAIRAIAGPPVHKPAGQPPDPGSLLADRSQAVSASVAPVASVRR